MPLLKDLIAIPERVHQGDFVLQLSRGVTEPERTLRDYVVTPQLVDAFSNALGFIQQAVQGNSAYDLSKFAWFGCMGEGERYLMGVGANSPLKTYADVEALSKKRPVKFPVTGLEGTATAAAIIGRIGVIPIPPAMKR